MKTFFNFGPFALHVKLKQFQNYLREEKISLIFLLHPDPNLTYFTQMCPSKGFLLVTSKKATFYLSKLDKKPKIRGMTTRLLPKKWEEKFKNNKITKVGINEIALSVHYLKKIKKIWPKAKFVDVSKKISELRALKTKEEIKKLRRACQITVRAFNALIKELPQKRLKTEQSVSFFLEKHIRENGCELSFPPIVASGKNSAIPHHITSAQKLKRGFLLLDFGAKYHNYHADMSRVLFLGTPKENEKEIYNLLLNAQKETICSVKEGVSAKELDTLVRKHLGSKSSYFIHALGHGVGVEIHEAPSLKEEEIKICKNQVFTIEPGIYFPDKFGLRIEDTVLFDGKVKILTKASKKLIEIKQ